MPLSYSVKFSTKHACYRARFWEAAIGYDAFAKVPDKFWESLGHEPPREELGERDRKRFEQLAIGWAVKERDRRQEDLKNKALGRLTNEIPLRKAFAMYQAEGRQKVSAETRKRDEISFGAIARHINVDRVAASEVDEPMLVTYVNARKLDAVQTRGKEGKLVDLKKTIRHRTVNNELNVLERVVRFAKRWESRTGCKAVRFPDEDAMREIRLGDQETTQVALTPEQFTELLGAVTMPWKRQVIIFGVCTRLREENLFGLRGEWIDWANHWLTIPAEHMKKGRSEKARTLSIPIPRIAMEQLGAPKLSGYIWTNPETGQPFTRIYDLGEMCETAGIPPISEHDLRTTGNTWLHVAGVDHLTRKALMGHSTKTGDVTDLYTQVIQSKMREAVAHYDVLFGRILRPGVKLVSIGRGE